MNLTFWDLSFLYFLLTLTACLASIQLACYSGGIRNLVFCQKRTLGKIISILLLLPSLAVFFIWNYIFPVAVIQGSQQAFLFSSGFIAALFFTLIISSFANRRLPVASKNSHNGLETLKSVTYFQAIRMKDDRQSD